MPIYIVTVNVGHEPLVGKTDDPREALRWKKEFELAGYTATLTTINDGGLKNAH